MRRVLSISLVFVVAWLATGLYPLIEVRKSDHFVLGNWPLISAYGTPIDAWQYIALHMMLSIFGTALTLVIWRLGRFLFCRCLTKRCS
jgi:hypothetical protein